MINLTANYANQRPPANGTVESHPVEGAYLVEDQMMPNGVNSLAKRHMVVFRQRRKKVMKSKYTIMAAILFVVFLLLIAGLIAGVYHPTESESSSAGENGRTYSSTDMTGKPQCGTRPGYGNRHTRVIHGHSPELGQWPWQVFVLVNGQYICGGAIVDPHWVFTAAHCLKNFGGNSKNEYIPSSAIQVVAGSLHKGVYGPESQVRNISRHIIHPDYPKEWLHINYDMMLLRLERPFDVDDYVRPVCVEEISPTELYAPGKRCIMAGWGFTSKRMHYPFDDGLELTFANVPLVEENECLRYASVISKRQTLQVTPQRFCAGYEDPVDIVDENSVPCPGDSGSPLVCEDPDTRLWHLVGVLSSGTRCGEVSYFTNVSALTDFWEVIYDESALPSAEFTCRNGEGSVPREWVCDSFPDCNDMSDETECECTDRQFECDNSMCILDIQVCDSVDHCGDGSDERDCQYFNCSNGVGQASMATVCDGIFDCGDGSDESNSMCVYDNATHFACDGNLRIPRIWMCDGIEDCGDHSVDEIGCDCKSNQFRCDDRCILKMHVCDNVYDCDDKSDEQQNCTCTGEGVFFCESAGLCWEEGMRDFCDLHGENKDCGTICDILDMCWTVRSRDVCENIASVLPTSYSISGNGG